MFFILQTFKRGKESLFLLWMVKYTAKQGCRWNIFKPAPTRQHLTQLAYTQKGKQNVLGDLSNQMLPLYCYPLFAFDSSFLWMSSPIESRRWGISISKLHYHYQLGCASIFILLLMPESVLCSSDKIVTKKLKHKLHMSPLAMGEISPFSICNLVFQRFLR